MLIDTTPDFRYQALRAHIERVDAILFTHSHADHVMGLDDVRPFNFRQGGGFRSTVARTPSGTSERCFHYIFDEARIGIFRAASGRRNIFDGAPFDLFGLEFTPIRLIHGRGTVYGFRFGNAAYLTDHSDIPEESMELLRGLDVLFLDALRHKPHPTHSTVDAPWNRWRNWAEARLLHAHLPRPWPRPHRRAACRRMFAWPTMAWKSPWKMPWVPA